MFLTFKGTMPTYVSVMSVSPPIKAGVSWGTVAVPGRPGVVITEKTVNPIIIPVEFLIEGSDHEEYLRNCEDFADWLESEHEEPLIFSNNPNRTYFAVAQGDFVPDEELNVYGQVTVDFFCPVGYKFGPEKSAVFYDGTVVLMNRGSLKTTKPEIYAEVLSDLTHLDIMADNAFMRIGEPPAEGVIPPQEEDLLFNSAMTNLTGWAYGGLLVDGGIAAGSFGVEGGGFVARDFGTNATWHGPAAKQAIPGGPLTDWRVEVALKQPTVAKKAGRVEVYLLSDSGTHIGKLAVVNGLNSTPNRIEVRIGGGANYVFPVKGNPNPVTRWANFDGVIRLSRRGNVYEYYIAQVDQKTGKHGPPLTGVFTDNENLYPGNLSQVQIHIGVYKAETAPLDEIKDIKIWRLNQIPDTTPRVIAKKGDMITLDFPNSAIYLNGEERKDLKHMFGRFFSLTRGQNVLAINPADKVNAVAIFREGFL